MKIENAHVYFIGMNDITISNVNDFFGSITIERTTGIKNNICYSDLFFDSTPNYDSYKETKRIRKFFYKAVKIVLKRDPNAVFLRYNEFSLHEFNYLNLKLLKANKYWVFRMFDNKFRCRKILKDVVDMLDYKYYRGKKMKGYILNHFDKQRNSTLVVQEKYGFSGSNTIVINGQNYRTYLSKLKWCTRYSVSEYIMDAWNTNAHVFIGETETILYEPSRQIVNNMDDHMVYIDGVFDLNDSEKSFVKESCAGIVAKIREKGYRGVLGIDFLVANGKAYFMEINPRFQRSSNKLNELLIRRGEQTLFQRQLSLFK